jgi:hypothetical protein
MKRLFEISSEERNRILEMHQSATKRNYLSEQETEPVKQGQPAAGPTINGVTYKLQGLTDKNINNFLNVPSNGGMCEFFDPVFYDILNQTRDKKNMVGWVSYCGTADPGNPCCDMVSNFKDYISVLGKSFNTIEQFKTYPFSKYMETSEKGKVFKSLWTGKMKELLKRSGNDGLYDEAKAKQLLGTKGQGSGETFDQAMFNFIVNNQLESAGLPKLKV